MVSVDGRAECVTVSPGYTRVDMDNGRDGILEDWPRPRGHPEDKIVWPWPLQCAALALASRGSGSKNTGLLCLRFHQYEKIPGLLYYCREA